MANLLSCVEYKKNGNSVKIVRRELLPVAGCSSVFSCVECVNYGSFTRELVAIYKGANGYALRIAGGAERVENYKREALELMAREYGINMHPRTVSALRANVKEVRADGQQIRPLRVKSKKGAKLSFDGVFSLMAEVIKAVKSVDGFLSGEALAL